MIPEVYKRLSTEERIKSLLELICEKGNLALTGEEKVGSAVKSISLAVEMIRRESFSSTVFGNKDC